MFLVNIGLVISPRPGAGAVGITQALQALSPVRGRCLEIFHALLSTVTVGLLLPAGVFPCVPFLACDLAFLVCIALIKVVAVICRSGPISGLARGPGLGVCPLVCAQQLGAVSFTFLSVFRKRCLVVKADQRFLLLLRDFPKISVYVHRCMYMCTGKKV